MTNFLQNLLKGKDYPEFFKEYLSQNFSTKDLEIESTRFVVFDTETTGFHQDLDRILSIGAVEVVNKEINISNSFEIYISQEKFNKTTVPIHGLTKNDVTGEMSELEAIESFINYIGNAILVAHHADFDIGMFNQMLERNGFKRLKNKFLDTKKLYEATRIRSPLIQKSDNSLDEIAEKFSLDVTDRHTAAGDALLTALIFLKVTSTLETKKQWNLRRMLKV